MMLAYQRHQLPQLRHKRTLLLQHGVAIKELRGEYLGRYVLGRHLGACKGRLLTMISVPCPGVQRKLKNNINSH